MAPSDFRKLQDKHVLVIGGTSGIGLSVAEALLADGANVTVSSSSETKINNTVTAFAADYPDRKVQGFPCDLSKPTIEKDLEALFQAAEASQGTIHHVVMTAGTFPRPHPLETIDIAKIEQVDGFRLISAVMVAKVAAHHLPKDSSSSLTITSGALSEKPRKGFSVMAYVAGGLQTLGRALAIEMAPIRVNVVRPGVIETPMIATFGEEFKNRIISEAESKLPTGKVGQSHDVAEAYLWFIKDKFVTGAIAASDGGHTIV